MSHRVHNFSAGPATLPLSVLEEVRDEFLDFRGSGMSLIESSHRGKHYSEVHAEAQADLRALLGLGEDFRILFLGGGASTQFHMVPQNLLGPGKKADYIVTGVWAQKAQKEAKHFGDIHVAHDSKDADGKYTRVPRQDELDPRPDAVYLHFATNNTIFGTQFHTFPVAPPGVALVADMSSDILWRPFDANAFGLIYAGAQKNLGPAGVTLVIVRQDVLEKCAAGLPSMASYRTHAEADSLHNTPPTFAIYVVGKVLRWIRDQGGLAALEAANRRKADLLYAALDGHGDFYRTPVARESRSVMNVVWRLSTEDLDKQFLAEAQKADMSGLKGHRSVGGCRASIYNAMPLEGVQALVDFLAEFARRNG